VVHFSRQAVCGREALRFDLSSYLFSAFFSLRLLSSFSVLLLLPGLFALHFSSPFSLSLCLPPPSPFFSPDRSIDTHVDGLIGGWMKVNQNTNKSCGRDDFVRE